MTVTEALQLIVKNEGVPALDYAIAYAAFAWRLVEDGHQSKSGFLTSELKLQLAYVLNNMSRWRQSKASTTTAMEIKECRATLKKASL